MAHNHPEKYDDLDIARRFEADLRRLKAQYPELTAPAAQRRLDDYLQIAAVEETDMPTRGHRAMGEDTTPIAVRLPRSIIAMIDAHVERMRKQHPYLPIGRVHALSDLIRRACDVIAADVTDTVTDTTFTPAKTGSIEPVSQEPAATSAGGAIPPAPAYEAQVLTPEAFPAPPMDIDPEETPLTMKPTDMTQESVVPQAEPVQTAKTTTKKSTSRATKGRK